MSPVFLFISGFARPSVKLIPKSISLDPMVNVLPLKEASTEVVLLESTTLLASDPSLF